MRLRFHLVLWLILVAAPLVSQTEHSNTKSQARLVFLPFDNETRDPDLDYLKKGIPETMISSFSDIGFVEEKPVRTLVIRPNGQPGPGISRESNPRRAFLDLAVADLTDEMFSLRNKGDLVSIARRLSARYVVIGSFSAGESDGSGDRPAEARAIFFDAKTGRRTEEKLTGTTRTLYDALPELALRLKKNVSKPVQYAVKFESSEDGGMVFLDEQYLGRTPFTWNLPAGTYELRFEQDGKKRINQSIEITGQRSVRLESRPLAQKGVLKVDSEPPGADVFLDVTKIGVTPLSRSDLPEGAHRVRVSLKDHVDRFAGVEISTKPTALALVLSPGDTQKVFRDPGHVILDWNYHDLSFYSFVNSMAFYGGWIYFNIQANRIQNSIRPMVTTLMITELITPRDPLTALYQSQQLEENRIKVHAQVRNAKASGIGGGLMLVLTGVFMWRGMAADARETGELGMRPILFSSTEYSAMSVPGRRWDLGMTMHF
ncbi:MAG: PEGA domain-containing protein [Spirochaetia bacterium]|nr:PEGA domain-containing protein [Spirochaetia bacterium]